MIFTPPTICASFRECFDLENNATEFFSRQLARISARANTQKLGRISKNMFCFSFVFCLGGGDLSPHIWFTEPGTLGLPNLCFALKNMQSPVSSKPVFDARVGTDWRQDLVIQHLPFTESFVTATAFSGFGWVGSA